MEGLLRGYTWWYKALIIWQAGILTVTAKHLQKLSSGTYRYERRIPADLRQHYRGNTLRKVSLKTKDPLVAAKKAQALAAQDDALWSSLRSPEARGQGITTRENNLAALALLERLGLSRGDAHSPDSDISKTWDLVWESYAEKKYGRSYEEARADVNFELKDVLDPVDREAMRLVLEKPGEQRVLLSDAAEMYIVESGRSHVDKFCSDARRLVSFAISTIGDLPLEQYKREHARSLRDAMVAKGQASGTTRKALNTISTIYSVATRETDRGDLPNPFAKLKIEGEGKDRKVRETFTTDELEKIAKGCVVHDDYIRHLVAMLLDTGARNSEIAGLRVSDVHAYAEIPHILVQAHEERGRTLKTENSKRIIPLVGMALWGARRALVRPLSDKSGWLFPKYVKKDAEGNDVLKATYASNGANKWLKSKMGVDKTTHCFRHTLNGRLATRETPKEIRDAICGWSSQDMSSHYGGGMGGQLAVLHDYMKAIELPMLQFIPINTGEKAGMGA